MIAQNTALFLLKVRLKSQGEYYAKNISMPSVHLVSLWSKWMWGFGVQKGYGIRGARLFGAPSKY